MSSFGIFKHLKLYAAKTESSACEMDSVGTAIESGRIEYVSKRVDVVACERFDVSFEKLRT